MQDKREYIIDKAFGVFMNVGYDSSSMTVLQKELKIARGGMYRYFKSKDDLFVAVMDKFFFGVISYFRPKITEEASLLDRIECDYQSRKALAKYLDKVVDKESIFLNYTALLIQGAKHYPKFLQIMKGIAETEFNSWVKAIENSITNEEIREDVNIKALARIFMKVCGFDGHETDKYSFVKAAENSKKILLYMYSLIKK